MKIDFVSDVTCPWCAIGLASLELAIARLGNAGVFELCFEPFELNPDIPAEGEELGHYARRRYGASATDLAARQALIMERAAEVGLAFIPRTRVWNTFDTHRLLYWAAPEGRQRQLMHALFAAYHERGENPGALDVLLHAVSEAGLDVERARAMLASGEFAGEVRARVRHWQSLGVHSVPSVIIDGRYVIQGGQPVEVFERAIRRP